MLFTYRRFFYLDQVWPLKGCSVIEGFQGWWEGIDVLLMIIWGGSLRTNRASGIIIFLNLWRSLFASKMAVFFTIVYPLNFLWSFTKKYIYTLEKNGYPNFYQLPPVFQLIMKKNIIYQIFVTKTVFWK